MAMVFQRYNLHVSVIPSLFLILSGQVTQIVSLNADVGHPEAKVEDALSIIEVLEDAPNELKVANKVLSYSVISLKCIFTPFSMAVLSAKETYSNKTIGKKFHIQNGCVLFASKQLKIPLRLCTMVFWWSWSRRLDVFSAGPKNGKLSTQSLYYVSVLSF